MSGIGRVLRYASVVVLGALVAGAAGAKADVLAITNATIIDGTGSAPIQQGTLVMENGRILSVGPGADVSIPRGATEINKQGKFVVPGLMDSNLHLYLNTSAEHLISYYGGYDKVVLEGAQIALKYGLTTVFDTWGPYEALRVVRDRIDQGELVGSTIYFAGNIIGFDGPISADFREDLKPLVSKDFVARVNEQWEQGTGRSLMWLGPDEVAEKVSKYAASEVDFLKYGASGHSDMEFITFSTRVQRAIVDASHAAGKLIQVHAVNPESIDMAIDAGVDTVTHCDMTGPVRPIPDDIIQKMVEENVSCSILPITDARLAALEEKVENCKCDGNGLTSFFPISRTNILNLYKAGVLLMLSTDAGVQDPISNSESTGVTIDPRTKIGEGHFNALLGLEQIGIPAMDILKMATINVAKGYGMEADLGSLEAGKWADLVVLDANPLESAHNYRAINAVVKRGQVVDRTRLPENPVISNRLPAGSE